MSLIKYIFVVATLLSIKAYAMNPNWKPVDTELYELTKDLGYYESDSILEKIKDLIAKGADVNVKDINGYTALMGAVWRSNPKFAEILIKAGANVHERDKDGNTPLLLAMATRKSAPLTKERIAKMLIDAGADINAQNYSGNTPLKWAPAEIKSKLLEFEKHAKTLKPESPLEATPLEQTHSGKQEEETYNAYTPLSPEEMEQMKNETRRHLEEHYPHLLPKPLESKQEKIEQVMEIQPQHTEKSSEHIPIEPPKQLSQKNQDASAHSLEQIEQEIAAEIDRLHPEQRKIFNETVKRLEEEEAIRNLEKQIYGFIDYSEEGDEKREEIKEVLEQLKRDNE